MSGAQKAIKEIGQEVGRKYYDGGKNGAGYEKYTDLFPQVLMPLMVPLSRALNCLKSKENYKRGNKLDETGKWIMLGKKLCDVTFILG